MGFCKHSWWCLLFSAIAKIICLYFLHYSRTLTKSIRLWMQPFKVFSLFCFICFVGSQNSPSNVLYTGPWSTLNATVGTTVSLYCQVNRTETGWPSTDNIVEWRWVIWRYQHWERPGEKDTRLLSSLKECWKFFEWFNLQDLPAICFQWFIRAYDRKCEQKWRRKLRMSDYSQRRNDLGANSKTFCVR